MLVPDEDLIEGDGNEMLWEGGLTEAHEDQASWDA